MRSPASMYSVGMSSKAKMAIFWAVFPLVVILSLHYALSQIFFYPRNLLDAAERGDLATVTLLLDKGVNLNTKDGWSGTPIKYAAVNGHTEIVALLLQRGAGINSRSTLDRTPLMYAANQGRDETVKFLLDKGADLSLKDDEGNTALMLAVERRHYSTASIIEEYLDHRGKMPLRKRFYVEIEESHNCLIR